MEKIWLTRSSESEHKTNIHSILIKSYISSTAITHTILQYFRIHLIIPRNEDIYPCSARIFLDICGVGVERFIVPDNIRVCKLIT